MAHTPAAIPPAPPAGSPSVRRVMQRNTSTDTQPEAAVRSEVHRRGLRYRKHYRPVSGIRCRADLVFAKAHVAVFVDGCFWHRCPIHGTSPRSNSAYWAAKLDRNVARDRANDAALERAGWRVLRVWEHEDPEGAAERIARVVRMREVD
jgi:DNA mismatch endonuclease, patch repair protein